MSKRRPITVIQAGRELASNRVTSVWCSSCPRPCTTVPRRRRCGWA